MLRTLHPRGSSKLGPSGGLAKRTRYALLALVGLALVVPAAAWAVGELSQKAGTAGCVSQGGTGGACQAGNALGGAVGVAQSPDGKNVYVASQTADAVAILDRNPTTGELKQKTGTAGCISESGTGGTCQAGTGLKQPVGVTVSADGKSVYVASIVSSAIAILDRNTTTGALSQKPNPAGCISEDGADYGTGLFGVCETGKALVNAAAVAVSADNKTVYATGAASSAVAVLDRDTSTGALTAKAGTAGCVSEDGTERPGGAVGACQDGTGLANARGIAISPNDHSVYVASYDSDAVTIFDRDTTSGQLTQKPAAAGCVSEAGGACQDGKALDAVGAVTVSHDGKSVYATSFHSDAVAILDRNTTSGALTQKAGIAGCISETGTGGACQDGKALGDPSHVAVSPDGKSVYAASSDSDAVAIFNRNTTSGALTQKAGIAGCVSESGTSGACQDGKALVGAQDVAVSSDGKRIYVASGGSGAVAVFNRVTAPQRQPDGQIKLAADKSFLGDNVWNVTGALQTRASSATRGQSKTFNLRLQNDGLVADKVVVKGCGSSAGFMVRYLHGTTVVTSKVIAGTYDTGTLAKGAASPLTLKIAVGPNAPVGATKSCSVTATSVAAPARRDVVVGRVKVAAG